MQIRVIRTRLMALSFCVLFVTLTNNVIGQSFTLSTSGLAIAHGLSSQEYLPLGKSLVLPERVYSFNANIVLEYHHSKYKLSPYIGYGVGNNNIGRNQYMLIDEAIGEIDSDHNPEELAAFNNSRSGRNHRFDQNQLIFGLSYAIKKYKSSNVSFNIEYNHSNFGISARDRSVHEQVVYKDVLQIDHYTDLLKHGGRMYLQNRMIYERFCINLVAGIGRNSTSTQTIVRTMVQTPRIQSYHVNFYESSRNYIFLGMGISLKL